MPARMKYKTIKEGEQAVVYNHLGEGELLVGPQRVFLFRKRLQLLKRYTADAYQYLVLKDRDGVVKHQQGPCDVFYNPLELDSVKALSAWKLDANHMIVVYKRLKGNDVERRVIQGPAIFVPEAEEWLHTFSWHGMDEQDQGRMIPDHNKFSMLTIIPDQFYYNVREVRTNDDTMITVKLMLFYSLKDVITMLDTTHDPIADLLNAVCADVIVFVGKLSYGQFLERSHALNELDTYPQLIQRAGRIGFKVGKVVYRGYHASHQLQAMQNNAIESRTQMRLNTEVQEQEQRLADFKLTKEQARLQLQHTMEEMRQKHLQQVQGLKQAHTLGLEEMSHKQSMDIESLQLKQDLDDKKAKDTENITYLGKLKQLNVDLDHYVSSRQKPPIKEEIQVVKS